MKKQCGRALNALKSMNPDKDKAQLFEMIEPAHDLLPKRLSMENYSAKFNIAPAIHERENDIPVLGESTQMLLELELDKKRKLTKMIDDKRNEDYLNWAYIQYAYQF